MDETMMSAEEEVFNAFILAVKDTSASLPTMKGKIQAFIKKGIPVNGFFRGLTPLMYACSYNTNSQAAGLLLEKGADASLKGLDGKTALDYALENPAFPHDRVFDALSSF